MGLGGELVRAGVTTEQALAHAEGVRARGFDSWSVTDLLVDLEHVDEEAMADALAEITGVSRWDGRTVDRSVFLRGRSRPVQVVGGCLYYATSTPFDMEQRRAMAEDARVADARPLVATRTQIVEAIYDSPDSIITYDHSPERVDEHRLREQWVEQPLAPDAPLTRYANSWLLLAGHAPGRMLRARAFDAAQVTVGRLGKAKLMHAGPRGLVTTGIYRIAAMACAPPGPGHRFGRILLYAPALEVFHVEVACTPAGESLWLRRVVPYTGVDGIADTEIGRLRHAFGQASSIEQRERIARTALGSPDLAPLDRLWALEMLGSVLDAARREAEARPFVDEALELVATHGIGGRAEASLLELRAATEIADPSQRAEWYARAARARRRAGIGRDLGALARNEELSARLNAGEHEACLPLAESIASQDRAAFGAPSFHSILALANGAEAAARLGRLDEAVAFERRIDTTGNPNLHWMAEYTKGFVAIASGRYREAIAHLQRAFDLPHAHPALVGAALARALMATDRNNEAIGVARGLAEQVDWSSHRVASELAQIRAMSPYR